LHNPGKRVSEARPRRPSRREVLGALGASLSFPLIEKAASCLSLPASAANAPQPIPTAVQTITTGAILGPVGILPDYFMGLAYEKGDFVTELLFTSANTSLAGLFNALGNGVLAIGALHLPFRFTETNSYLYGGSPGVSNAYASALWVIDHLFHIALGGACGVNMQGGDSADYTPIANLGSTVLEAMPEYYGLLLFSLAGQGTLLQTKLAVTDFNATMYAVLNPSGGMNIVIVNKEVYSSLRITINCGKSISSASLIELYNTDLSATTGQTIQGATVSTDGSFNLGAPYAPENISSFWVTCYVPAISAVLIQIR
jgi:hypothetical protein